MGAMPASRYAFGSVPWYSVLIVTGEITVKLDVTVDALSASAKDKILAAGGSVSDS